jgi:hypothetical protein
MPSVNDPSEGGAPDDELMLPPMPEIGHSEGYYAKQVIRADKAENQHVREAAKVGQYITLALDSHLEWEKKLRYFQHALRRHCVAPPLASEKVWIFYAQLANLVRQYAGLEALRLASKEDDLYAKRLAMGQLREKITGEAEDFLESIMGEGGRPPHFNQEDWEQLKLIRNQWK